MSKVARTEPRGFTKLTIAALTHGDRLLPRIPGCDFATTNIEYDLKQLKTAAWMGELLHRRPCFRSAKAPPPPQVLKVLTYGA